MTSLRLADPLSAFTRINESVYVYESSIEAHNTSEPDTILLLSWGQAPTRNIIKYFNHYKSLYPTSRILLIRTPFSDLIFHTQTSQKAVSAPAVDILSGGRVSRLLVHVFSNGGTYKLCELAKAYKRTYKTILPIRTLIFDSAPGKPHFRRSIRALKHILPKPWYLYFPALIVLYVYLASLYTFHTVTGGVPISTRVWHEVNDPELVDERAERLYLFSKDDGMIWWEDVVEHAANAREKGWKVVRTEEFVGSKHVAHMVLDPERYWDIVTRFWRASGS